MRHFQMLHHDLIHQFSFKVFSAFGKIMLLSGVLCKYRVAVVRVLPQIMLHGMDKNK